MLEAQPQLVSTIINLYIPWRRQTTHTYRVNPSQWLQEHPDPRT